MHYFSIKTAILFLLICSSNLFGQQSSISNFVTKHLDENPERPVNNILLYVEKPDKKLVFNQGFGITKKDGETVSENDQYRIASITKTFVATIILQMAEENKLKLNDKAYKYLGKNEYVQFEKLHLLNGRSYSKKITIKDLLSHRSGLADIFSDKQDEFFGRLLKAPQKQFSPKSIVEMFYNLELNKTPHFKPNKGWHYSDMNYVLLGLIIENLDNKTLAGSIRDRILIPLEMENTYFEFYEKPNKVGKRVHQFIDGLHMNEINTSFDWAGGGLVSNNKDLATFIKALFAGKLIKAKSLKKMIKVRYTKSNEDRYGLGIYESKLNGETYFGHYGFYGSYVGFSPKSNTTLVYNISQSNPKFNVREFIYEALKLIEK